MHLFLTPLTLQNIAQLRDPSERVPLGERLPYEDALALIQDGAFDRVQVERSPLSLRFLWKDWASKSEIAVAVTEESPRGPLKFSCSTCTKAGRKADSCEHQWASYVLLWQALTTDLDDLAHPELQKLARELLKPNLDEDPRSLRAEWANVKLDSISLFLDEPPLLKGPALSTLLNVDLSKYRPHEVQKSEELLSPRIWNLPEIFRRKVTAFSEHYYNDINKQNRMADTVRYNFSNGLQISAKEILRHPLHKKVPGELLPQIKGVTPIFNRWPLIQSTDKIFVSQAVEEMEEIAQTLLAQVAEAHRQGKIDLYLQTKSLSPKAMDLHSVEFDPVHEVDWRVEFNDRKELETEFKLVSFRNRELNFYESFAVDPVDGVVVVYPWLRELSRLQEVLSNLSETLVLGEKQMPTIRVTGELLTKSILKHLRSRPIPVKISGESRTLAPDQSRVQIHFNTEGAFYVQHDARVLGQKDLSRRGWTSETDLYLQILSMGLPYLLGTEPRDIAARTRAKREWDIKLLKHLGILQYLFLEILACRFDGTLTDGTPVSVENLFTMLQPRIRNLLIAGAGSSFVRDVPLSELCSKPVLTCFEDFVNVTYKAVGKSESFYSESGEVILEGVVEREFRLLYELMKRLAADSGGETFRRSRSTLLSKITTSADPQLFKFGTAALQGALESVRFLVPSGFQLFVNEQPLQELGENDFNVEFFLRGETDQRFFNWFELNPKFFLLGQEVDPDQFLSIGGGGVIEYAGKLYMVGPTQLPSLRRLENFWNKLQKGRTEKAKRKGIDNIFQLPRSQTLELLALRASGVKIRGDENWNQLCEFYDSLGTQTRELRLPESMKADLKPYQAVGVQWLQDLYRLRLGALLADDMGLGKTLQTLCFLDDLRDRGELGTTLIVVPSSLIFNWQQEVEKFTPQLPLTVFTSRDRERIGHALNVGETMVVITTYGMLMEHEGFLNQFKWKVVVFDEAQNLKNITTKRTSAARSLTAQFKIGLTGTPMENHYGEFYSLVDILVPGSLGAIDDFRRQFVNTEMVTREEIDDLKLKIRPLLLRRTKKEILDQLPEKQETKVSIAFEDKQKEIYRDIALSYNQRVQETMAAKGEASVQLQMLTALLRLRQACSDPAALPNVVYEKVPPKLETLLDSIGEIVESGESALVFTQFLQTLEHSARILKAAGIPVFVLHGGVPTAQRQKILADFNAVPGGAVLIMTLKTGGVGLNLTKASYVFHLEPWWNPSVENQATDRAHRLGQNKAVQVFRYIMHESLEEKIELLKERKDRKFQSLFENVEKDGDLGNGGAALSKEDFDLLLGLR